MELLFCLTASLVVYSLMAYLITGINYIDLNRNYGTISFSKGFIGWPILAFWNIAIDDWGQKITSTAILVLAICVLIFIWQPIIHPVVTIFLFLFISLSKFFAWLVYELKDI